MSAALEMSGQIGTMTRRFRRRPSKAHHLAAGLSVIAALSLVVPAAAQTVKIQTIKVTAPGTTTAPGKPAALGNAASRPHVYLMRGLMNIFSLGMDQLAGQIAGSGIDASVYNHSVAESVVGSIVQRYRGGDHGPYILVGHSLGADAVMTMTQQLNLQGVPVALVVPFDGTGSYTTPSNVACVLNFTQRAYAYMQAGAGFHGKLSNVDVSSDTSIDHVTIDKSPRLQTLALTAILQAAHGQSCRPAGSAPMVGRSKEMPLPTLPKEAAPKQATPAKNVSSQKNASPPKNTVPAKSASPALPSGSAG
jgi:hypothetical protein